MHVALVAARTTVSELRRVFVEAFPRLKVIESAEFTTAEELQEWIKAHERLVSGARARPEDRGTTLIAFWQDGPWAVLADRSYVLAAGDDRLASLSTRFRVLSFLVESAGGTAYFACFEQGRCRRSILNVDGAVIVEGHPLPEEADIDVGAYYMEESHSLACAFGLSSLEYAAGIARWTDFSAVRAMDGNVSVEQPRPRRPWWKLW
jgi:hypothetical protein